MEIPPTRDLAIAAGATLTAIFAFYHVRERRNRTRKIRKTDERVLILGASSGVGRALAHMYAIRGARVCVVGRRQREIEEVERDCKVIQRIKESDEDRNTFSFCGDFANPEQMIMLRDVIQAGESPSISLAGFTCTDRRVPSYAEWQGVDTVIITAGVISLQPLLSVANLKHDSDHVELEGVQRVVEVAQAALHSNFIGPLVSATIFVRGFTLQEYIEVFNCLFYIDPLTALYIKLTLNPAHVLHSLRHPRAHPVPICCDEILFSAVIRIPGDRAPINSVLPRDAEHNQGRLPFIRSGRRKHTRRVSRPEPEGFR